MNDTTVVVTGGTRGIGRAVASEFAAGGARVVVCGRDADAVEGTVSELSSAGGDVSGMRADVRDEFDLERLMERAAAGGRSIDVVVANAGVNHADPGSAPVGEEPYSRFDDTVRTNVRGVFATVKEALPHLAADARILVPSGSVARDAKPGMGTYAVSKAGAEALARQFAADLEQTVCVVDPGLVATDLTRAEQARDPDSVAPMFVWAATEADTEQIDGAIVDLRAWKKATR
ncbi:SDR family NAD(P)-dependent oxidoreductase [Haloferacaceae archaeon DSL9]